ncbi:MAG: FAD-dependent oxidoreductase [Desulfurococcaceae archaeon]
MESEVIVVGSGAGGGTVAFELASRGFQVLLIEEGERVSAGESRRAYSPLSSSVEVLRAKCLGGSALLSLGNMVADEGMLSKIRGLGVDLSAELLRVKELMCVTETPMEKLPPFAVKFFRVAEYMGLKPKVMPKSILHELCIGCGECAYGCRRNAKRTSLDLILRAEAMGLKVTTGLRAVKASRSCGDSRILVEGEVRGGRTLLSCKALVLAAGALETPSLLAQLHDDENVGRGLFVDPFVTLGGPYNGETSRLGVQMAVYADLDGYMISPHYSGLLLPQLAAKGVRAHEGNIASLMVKVADEGGGRILPSGAVVTRMSERDVEALNNGIGRARELLVEMGVKEKDIAVTPVRGAHPGGTAAIGRVVDRDLTINGCDGVFVADASLIPPPLGKPPIMLIMALALKAAKRIEEYLRR